ncbi:hypothetical protein K3495_g10257 [Podosphaera aphanis]|nr:hypothetical protein K3495_g10257 [Podosphaera aphanis]
MPPVSVPSKAGIIETISGERHIPSSIRADGTKRKEIKIRPGYKPLEDVEVYKNRTVESWKSRGKGGIPGATVASNEQTTEAAATSNKNTKRREARRKAKELVEQMKEEEQEQATDQPIDLEVKKEKVIRNIKKKLRQAKDLEEKEQTGSKLTPEQAIKVAKITELILELEALELKNCGDNDTYINERDKTQMMKV